MKCFAIDLTAFAAGNEAPGKLTASGSLTLAEKLELPPERGRPNRFSEALPIAQAWNGATNLPQESELTTMARHSLVFGAPFILGSYWNNQQYEGLSTGLDGTDRAGKMYEELHQHNDKIKILTELRYRDAPSDHFLPEDSKWWMSDPNSASSDNRIGGYVGRKMLDFTNRQLHDQVATQARVAVQAGASDGIMLDWFNDGKYSGGKYDQSRLELLQKIRLAIGPDKLLLINTNDEIMPDSLTKLVNGYYMECPNTQSTHPNGSIKPQDWKKIESTLDSAETNTRSPHINIVETWFDKDQDRSELHKMRATLGLVLTHAPDGYALFGDPDGANSKEHLHDWYDFYNTKIGNVTGSLTRQADGRQSREYENGIVVYNPEYNHKPIAVKFDRPWYSVARHKWGTAFALEAYDADIFLRAD
jgi:hypothetical protein